ncbi:MAG TPA: Tol-Pal system protein TolB, partial [Xanthomonadales bacterium]|nr:Tol-Pal system protein TolB [Xanthomonadales bacterium]
MDTSARGVWQRMPAALACLLLAALLWAPTAQAKLEIEIIKGHASALPIAVVPFQWRASGYPPITSVTDVISQDLYRSGLFDPVDEADMAERPVDAESIRFGTWRLLKTDYIVIGWVNNAPDGNGYDIVYQLFDVHTQERLLSQITSVGLGDLRFGAHRVADAIYEKLTGVPGA